VVVDDDRDEVAPFTNDLVVHEKVLQFLLPAESKWPETPARTPGSNRSPTSARTTQPASGTWTSPGIDSE
jgi:hypothetical protein